MLDNKNPLIGLNEMGIYHEEIKDYIKSQGLDLSEEDINGLIDTKLVPVNETIENKVEKVDGMGLSTNNYSDTDKEKLSTVAEGAEVNVQSDWNITDTTSDAFIKNKPITLPANGGNADTVNGHTVEINVPSDAKFTDTLYDDTALLNRVKSIEDDYLVYDDKTELESAIETAKNSAKSYTDTKVNGLASTTVVDNKVSAHNTSTSAHNDIRELISGLTTRLNALADSDDTTLDQMSEIVAYIKSNKSLIDSITTSKVNVSDIIDNLTTASASKVLSSNQGVVIKGLIDTLQNELDNHTHTISDVSGLQSALDGKAASSHGTHVTYGTDIPLVAGTGAVGTSTGLARIDHVHPAQTTISGNAGSATKLATARTIDGVSFNGSASITHYGTCSTAAATAAKTVALTGFTLATGARVLVKFTVTNTASSPTLNVNSTGAKAIMYRGSAITAGYLAANRVYEFVYDGTDWELVGDINTDNNTKNTAGSTNNSSKLFLIGATSQTENPQTYSHDTAYVGTDGCLYSGGVRVRSEIESDTEPIGQLEGDYWTFSY